MLLVVVAAAGPVPSAIAETPIVTIDFLPSLTATTPTIEGLAGTAEGDEPTVSVTIYLEGSVVASGHPSVEPNGEWTYAPGHLPDGTYTVEATERNEAAEVASAERTFRIDSTPPAVTMNAVTTPTSNPTPTLGGGVGTEEGDQGVSVTIYKGTSVGGTVAASGNASKNGAAWSYTAPHLADGAYTAQAAQVDWAGNVGHSAPVSFQVEAEPPKVTLNPVKTPANNKTPSFTGTATNTTPVTVKIYAGATATGSVVATATATGTGPAWSSTAASPGLNDGQYTAIATQPSSLPEVPSGTSAAVTFKVETEPPKVTLNPVKTPSNNKTPSFSGTATNTTPVTVNVYAGATVTGTPVATATATGNGAAWSSGAASPALQDGEYTAAATQPSSLPAEVPAGTSVPVTFIVKTVAPTVTLSTTTFVHREKPAEFVTGATPSFTGTATTGPEYTKPVTVNIYKGTTATGTPVKTVLGTASGTPWAAGPATPLTEGTYTAQATQEDEAHNIGKSEPVTFAVDTTAPVVAFTTPGSKQELHVSRPTFSGTAGAARGDLPLVTLNISEGGSGTPQTLKIVPSGGKWTTESTGPRLRNGTYTAEAEQSDDAGNIGKSKVTFTIKTTSPEVTLSTIGLVHRGTELVTGPTPSFSGTAGIALEDGKSVTLDIYTGTSASGSPIRTMEQPLSGVAWATGPVSALPPGTYTVQAEQQDLAAGSQPGVSGSVTFTVDATVPQITLVSPADGGSATGESQLVTGSAGTAEGDLPEVTVQLFSGTGTAGGPVQSINVNAAGGLWSATVGGLSPGTYTVRAEQSDDVGNVGMSSPATFTVNAPASGVALAPPAASFSWVPASPHTGESVSLLSSSTDATSPITGFAWDLAGNGAFASGPAVMTTSFATAGRHLVQLRVTNASGLSSVAAGAIEVTSPPLPVMRPFPIVRITASRVSSGVRIRLLSVQASSAARITVACIGHGCPIKSQTRAASAGRVRPGAVAFRRLERFLPAGVTLEVRVSKPGVIGKYTRFTVRRGRSPSRLDECLGPAGVKPMACPSS